MFDKVLDKAFDNIVPKALDLGSFDKAINWIRDAAFHAHSMNLPDSRLKILLSSWLKFAQDFDDIFKIHHNALCCYTSVIFFELTGIEYDFLNDFCSEVKNV